MARPGTRNPNNPDTSLFRFLTKLFSGPIVNYRTQTYRQLRRRELDKYKPWLKSASGQPFKRASYSPFEYLQTRYMLNQNRLERYTDFEQMEYDPILSCFTGDTKVAALEGFMSFEKLTEKYGDGTPFDVWAWDDEHSKYTVGKAHHPRCMGEKEVMEVVLDNGKSFKCTPDHRIMLVDGTYKQAQYLDEGEALMPFSYSDDKTHGYYTVRWPTGGHRPMHRYIFEEVLKTVARGSGLQIHHKNLNKRDNRLCNLQIMTAQEHADWHGIDIETCRKKGISSKIRWEQGTEEDKKNMLRGLTTWLQDENNKPFRSAHTAQINRDRWANDLEYSEKMRKIFSENAKKLWQNEEYKERFFERRSKLMKLKHANDLEFHESCVNYGPDNGKYAKEITNEQILLEGLKYNTLRELAESFDFGNREFKKSWYKCQFIVRRMRECGYKSWKHYKETYQYSNHKVRKIIKTGEVVPVYDLTVDYYENFALECGAIVSNSCLDLVADEITTCSSLQPMLTINCANLEIKGVLETLFKNILNIESNLFGWSRSLVKYGDSFLYLDIDDKNGIQNIIGLPIREVEKLEGEDPQNPNYVQYQWNSAGLTLENWQVAHFRIMGQEKYNPYGQSHLEPARRIWRMLTLMEDNMLAYRVIRSPERRVFYIDVSGVDPEDVEQFIQKQMTSMKRASIVDSDTGRVDLRNSVQSVEEDFWIPVRGAANQSKIEVLRGGEWASAIEDIKYLRDKLYAAIKVPAAYLSRSDDSSEDAASLCLSLNTKIPLLDGRSLTLQEIIREYDDQRELYAYSIDTDTQKIIPGKIKWAGITQRNVNKMLRITLDNGEVLECTPNHELVLRDGIKKQAHELSEGQSLMPFDGEYEHKIIKIEEYDTLEDVGCLTIENEFHNFAIEAGIFVGNSQKDIRFARTVQRYQRAIVSELTKMAIIHLFILGFRKNDLLGFTLHLNNPSKIAELQELEHWRSRFNVASQAIEGFFSRRWIAQKFFGMSEEEFVRNQRELFYDRALDAELDALAGNMAGQQGMGPGGGDLGMPGGGDEFAGMPGIEGGPPETSELPGGGGGEVPAGAGGGGEESTLLAAPAKRDDDAYTKPGWKGKTYAPVKVDNRDVGARLRHMQSQWADEKASDTNRNIIPGYRGLHTAAMGIMEDDGTKRDERAILQNEYETNKLIQSLEKMKDKTSSTKIIMDE